jgi:broad specificity phosphatase PhoE
MRTAVCGGTGGTGPQRRSSARVGRRTISVFVAIATSAVLGGCATGAPPDVGGGGAPATPAVSPPTTHATPNPVAPPKVVMIIRHGEKPEGDAPGIDANGNEDDGSLTEVGWDRAHRLVDLFGAAPGLPRAGLARPSAVYAAGANDDGEGARTRETVGPLTDKLGIAMDTSFGKGDEEELVERVVTEPGPTLISWSHGSIPDLAEAFPNVTPTPPSEWPDERFDVVWTFTKTGKGWRFAQLPELALPQDEDSVITE